MGDAISAGVFALAGTLLGGLAGYAATAVEIRSRRGEAEAARRDALTQNRRVLYSTLVERADLTVEASRRMWAHASVASIAREDYDAYVATWESLVAARAAVAIVGPREAAEAATVLFKAVAAVCNCVDEWINGAPWSPASDTKYLRERQRRNECRDHFVEIAQAVLSTAST